MLHKPCASFSRSQRDNQMNHNLLIIQSTAGKLPGSITDTAADHNVNLRIIKLWRKNTAIPSSLNKYDGLMFLDTFTTEPQNSIFPRSIHRINDVITKSLDEDRPYLGIGYGHHILASHYGATIADNYNPSAGFTTGFITHKGREHPIFNGLPGKFLLFKWHKQAIMSPLPANIDVLASSISCQFEAISIVSRPHLIGLQFANNSATPKDIKAVTKGKNWLSSKDMDEIPAIIDEAARVGAIATTHFATIFSNFIKIIKNHAATANTDYTSITVPHRIPAHGGLL
jgi:GMP synthase-like glutamine amidotransferase